MSIEWKLEKTDIDLNALFNLSYSFENLKGLLTAVLKNQDTLAEKVKNLEEQGQKNTDIINKTIINEKRIKHIDVIKSKDQEDTSSNKELDSNQLAKKSKVTDSKEGKKEEDVTDENENEGDNDYYNNFDDSEIIKRLDDLEQKMKKMELNKFTSFTGGSSGSGEDIELQKIGLKSLEDKFEDMRLKNEDMKKQLEDLAIKCNDFNIYDLFKDAKVEGGNIDLSKVLIMNLEQKVFKKFDTVDEKIKKLNEL